MLNAQTEEEIYNKIAGDMEKFVSNQDNTYKTYIGIFTNFLNQYTACLQQLATLQQQQVSLLNASSYLGLNNNVANLGGIFSDGENSGWHTGFNSEKGVNPHAGTRDTDAVSQLGYDPNTDYSWILSGNSGDTLTAQERQQLEKERQAKIDDLYNGKDPSKSYAEGIENGPVTYTGLTMLHGTPSSPEFVLNSDQAYTLLRNIATLKMPEYERVDNNHDCGTQYIVQGDIVLENCDNPEEFWNDVTRAMRNRYNVTKHQR